jgi:large subunit ribosomal protein L29
MQVKDLRSLDVGELRRKEGDLREELCRLRMRRGVSQLENPMKVRATRRDLARVLTVLRAMEGKREARS